MIVRSAEEFDPCNFKKYLSEAGGSIENTRSLICEAMQKTHSHHMMKDTCYNIRK
jgi:hypothetical protein